jgi:hypothetical protein
MHSRMTIYFPEVSEISRFPLVLVAACHEYALATAKLCSLVIRV